MILDTRRQRVWRAAQEIPLPKLSYDMFVTLVRRSPEVASNEELMKAVWPGLVVSPETVSQRVKLLREALGDDSRTPRYIGSLRARGYHLVPPAEVLPDNGEPPQGEAAPAPAAPVELSVVEAVGGEARRARPDWAVTEIPSAEMRTLHLTEAADKPASTRWRYLSWSLIGAVILGLAYLAFRHGI